MIVAILIFIMVFFGRPREARSDFWGGDVIVLSQILAQSIQQLAQLRGLLANGQDSLGLIRDINRGINDSLILFRTISPNTNPGIYADWMKVQDALAKLQTIYGIVIPGARDATVYRDADQSVAEAISRNNMIYDYTRQIDEIGEAVKSYSHQTSPGGAQKLTAQTLGVMLNVMNESLRAQATGIKLQAQSLAIENKKDKDMIRQMDGATSSLQSAMKNQPADFSIPRF